MKFSKWSAGIAALVLAVSSGAVNAEIRIGVAGPMKGQFGPLGLQMQAGAAQAVADINQAGGINGEELVLEVVDDACDEATATAVANQLVGKTVALVVGHFCFGASVAASEVYAAQNIVQISPATTLPGYTDLRPGPGIYRLAQRDDGQAQLIGRMLAEEFSDENIALLHDKTGYGKGLIDDVKDVMNGFGKSEAVNLGFDAGEDDYRKLVARLVLDDVTTVFVGGFHPEIGLIKLEMDRQGLSGQLIAGDTLITDEFWAVTGPAGEGTLFAYPEDLRQSPAAQNLIAELEAQELPADRYALSSYAAVQIWAQAVQANGSTDFDQVVETLDGSRFETVIGSVTFDGKGDSNRPTFAVYEWQDGDPVQRR